MIESETLELKKSTSELKEALISIAAILNKHQKGELYFGVKPNGQVIGQLVAEKTIRDISKSISDHIEPKIFPKINEVILEEKKCVRIEFSGENVPYYAQGRAYMRVGDEDKKLSPQELEKLILRKKQILWEEEISEKTIAEVNEEAVRDFIERANTAKRIDFKFTNVKSVLNKLGLMKGDKLLKATEVLFCDNNLLEIQAAVFAGTDKLTFLDIRQFKGNIFQLLQQSESYTKEHINWRAELKERVRKEIPEIPIRAITEALVNSLCHRDYTNRKGNEVAIFKDRVEIYNPGQFPEGYTPKDFIKGAERSIPKNPLLANTLYLSKDIERWGSGLKRIYDACQEEKVKVDFKELKSGFLVIFYRKEWEKEINDELKDTVKDADKSKDLEKDLVNNLEKDLRLTKNQRQIIFEITKNNYITQQELSVIVGINEKNIRNNIVKLKEKKIIKRIGPDKGGHWEITSQNGTVRFVSDSTIST
jgi:ATP-dependent DNA helicase RecG